jgi:hypothetical protein
MTQNIRHATRRSHSPQERRKADPLSRRVETPFSAHAANEAL